MDEAIVQAAYAGIFPPTYVNVTTGPSSTADIESHRVSPATGPKNFHLILIDDGRTVASKDPALKEGLLCIKCGRCYFSCSTYRVVGTDWISRVSPYNGPTGGYVELHNKQGSIACQLLCPFWWMQGGMPN